MLISMVTSDNITQLKRAVENRKIDGAILTRTLADDAPMKYLMHSGVPFVAIGSTDDKQVVQVDNDHRSACRELTHILLQRGAGRIALVGGDENYMVNRNRLKGFQDAFCHDQLQACDAAASGNVSDDERFRIFMNVSDSRQVDRAVEQILKEKISCIVCMDDFLCGCVLDSLQTRHIAVPQQVQTASFYDSAANANRIPSITSLRFDAEKLGIKACELLLGMLDGESVEPHTLLGYEVCMRESTCRE